MSTSDNLASLCIEPVAAKFLCGICSDVMFEPHQCPAGHCFCLECISCCLHATGRCPQCKEDPPIPPDQNHDCDRGSPKSRPSPGPGPRSGSKSSPRSKASPTSSPRSNSSPDSSPRSSSSSSASLSGTGGLSVQSLVHCRVVESMIGKLAVRCQNYNIRSPKNKRGCEWKGAVSSLKHHVEFDCGLTMEECVNVSRGCMIMTQRDMADQHLKECLFEGVMCEICGAPDVCRGQIDDEHMKVCGGVEVKCANGCGMKHLRRDSSVHNMTCLKSVVVCPFAKYGCVVDGNLRKCDYDSHQVSAASRHAELVADVVADMSTRMTKMEAIMFSRHTELNDLKEDFSSQTRQLADVLSYLQNGEQLRQSQAVEVENLKKELYGGVVNVTWNANVNKARSSSKKYDNSKEFSVIVPGAGEYKCMLQLAVEDGSCFGVYNIINKGPIFPIAVSVQVSCRAHTSLWVSNIMPAKDGFGFPRFISNAQVDAAKTSSGHITISATIKLKCASVLNI